MKFMPGIMLHCLLIGSLLVAGTASADESLETCEAEKVRQMELSRSVKRPPKSEYNPHTGRTYNSFDETSAKDDIERIDTWLWKNCRSHSEELRKIEQQYM